MAPGTVCMEERRKISAGRQADLRPITDTATCAISKATIPVTGMVVIGTAMATGMAEMDIGITGGTVVIKAGGGWSVPLGITTLRRCTPILIHIHRPLHRIGTIVPIRPATTRMCRYAMSLGKRC